MIANTSVTCMVVLNSKYNPLWHVLGARPCDLPSLIRRLSRLRRLVLGPVVDIPALLFRARARAWCCGRVAHFIFCPGRCRSLARKPGCRLETGTI
jgi:hypothetical protein